MRRLFYFSVAASTATTPIITPMTAKQISASGMLLSITMPPTMNAVNAAALNNVSILSLNNDFYLSSCPALHRDPVAGHERGNHFFGVHPCTNSSILTLSTSATALIEPRFGLDFPQLSTTPLLRPAFSSSEWIVSPCSAHSSLIRSRIISTTSFFGIDKG